MTNPSAPELEARPERPFEREAGLAFIKASPLDHGTLDMIVRRPTVGAREVVEAGELDTGLGLVGDSWLRRARVHPDMQLNVMNARMALLLAPDEMGRALAGDQLYLDLDLTEANLPAGTRLRVGETAVIEVTAEPHTGCKKFSARFGADMTRFVNVGEGKRLRLRGICAKVVEGGTIRRGDAVSKL